MLDMPARMPSGRKKGTLSIARKVVVSVALTRQMRRSPPR
jgi:hypothetical protein